MPKPEKRKTAQFLRDAYALENAVQMLLKGKFAPGPKHLQGSRTPVYHYAHLQG